MNISRITQLVEDGTWESNYGLMYQFLVTFEDGGHGQSKAKAKAPPYRVGDEVGYEYTGTYPKGQKLKITAKPYGDGARPAQQPAAAAVRPPARAAQPARAPAAAPRSAVPAGQPATEGRADGTVNGQTVGMAVKAAVDLIIHNARAGKGAGEPIQPVDLVLLQNDVEAIATSLILASRNLEAGKLAEPEDVPY